MAVSSNTNSKKIGRAPNHVSNARAIAAAASVAALLLAACSPDTSTSYDPRIDGVIGENFPTPDPSILGDMSNTRRTTPTPSAPTTPTTPTSAPATAPAAPEAPK